MNLSNDADTRMLLRALRDGPSQDAAALTFVPDALPPPERAARRATLASLLGQLIASGHVAKDGEGLHALSASGLADLSAFDQQNGIAAVAASTEQKP